MKNLLITALTSFICAPPLTAQITLREYDDPAIGGYESIVFEYETNTPTAPGQPPGKEKIKKVFDIEENNPYNQLALPVAGQNRSGAKVYRLTPQDINQIKSRFGLDSGFQIAEDARLTSFHRANKTGNYVTISYNSIVRSEGEWVEEGRSSTLVAMNEKGQEILRLEDLPHDIYSVTISENGKYVAFASGEHLEHSGFSSVPMFHIYITNTGSIYYKEKVETSGIDAIYGMITIGSYMEEKFRAIILDALTGNIYEALYTNEEGIFIRGYNQLAIGNKELRFNDLTRIK